MAAYTHSIIGSSLRETSSLMAASTPALPEASRTLMPSCLWSIRNCLTTSITFCIVPALWSVR